jgi:uncharacterized protein YbbC (DUF1343 family)
MEKFIAAVIFLIFFISCTQGQTTDLVVGAEQPEEYLSLLNDKRVALVVNHTSRVKQVHLVDFLISKNITIEKIFAPEHGFRGEASAGAEIIDDVDLKTGIPVISLYGENRKPTKEHLRNIDIVVFDIQDVGCRFYTYISTLHLVMEACAENNVPLLVLDRPNPNGDYVAGPVRKPGFESFVSMDPIALVHGCTIGEMAKMINGEGWLDNGEKCNLKIVPVLNYTHSTKYELPVKPSPNLPNFTSIRLYPSLCFFEATSASIGRGTKFPFQVIGGANPSLGNFQFTPVSNPGVSDHPLNEGKICYGIDLRDLSEIPNFTLRYFLDFWNKYEDKSDFLTRENWFNLLAGTDQLLNWIKAGKTESEINALLAPEIEEYKSMRKNYLLYPDFE